MPTIPIQTTSPRLAKLHHRAATEPWFLQTAGVLAAYLQALENIFQRCDDDDKDDEEKEEVRLNIWGNEIPQYQLLGSTAIIPVSGIMLKGAGNFERWLGFAGHDDIARDLDRAANEAVRVILHIDSPGGTAIGTPELAEKITALAQTMDVFAFSDTMMTSAAYYIAAGASAILATPSAIVGSIGTIMQIADASEAYKAFGINWQTLVSGDYKGMGDEKAPLTDKQRQFLQDTVNQSALQFQEFILKHRGRIDTGAMQGQWWDADKSPPGFIDELILSRSDLLRLLGETTS